MIKLVEGAISTKACILNHKREINTIYIDSAKKTRDFDYIRKLAKENNIKLVESKRSELDTFASGKSYGGILADVGERVNDEFDDGDVFYIDGIEDPFNLGYIIRTLYAFGFKNIMLPRYIYSEAQIIKSSAGAYEMANIKIVDNDIEEIESLKNKGYISFSLERSDEAIDIFEADFNDKALFIIGGEKRGISNYLEKYIDLKLYIPYGSNFRNSLSGASSVDVLATLLYRQRNYD